MRWSADTNLLVVLHAKLMKNKYLTWQPHHNIEDLV